MSSGLERGVFTYQGDIHGKDFGKFMLQRQGKCIHRVLLCIIFSSPARVDSTNDSVSFLAEACLFHAIAIINYIIKYAYLEFTVQILS